MATTLEVVNSCLATLGEKPLNTLSEPHIFKAPAVRALTEANKRLQAPGWWFNIEAMTMTPAPTTGHMQLPGDCIKWQSGVRSSDTLVRSQAKPWIVQRGSRLYDTRLHTYAMTEDVTGEIIRLVNFEELPPVINDYVAAETVLKFQSNFDADNSRRQELAQSWLLAKTEAKSENIRQLGVNMLNNNVRLQRIKSVTRRLRY